VHARAGADADDRDAHTMRHGIRHGGGYRFYYERRSSRGFERNGVAHDGDRLVGRTPAHLELVRARCALRKKPHVTDDADAACDDGANARDDFAGALDFHQIASGVRETPRRRHRDVVVRFVARERQIPRAARRADRGAPPA
jgi:hypothetical protein